MPAALSDLRSHLRSHCLSKQLSIRRAAKEMGVSFSALARLMRGQTQEPGPHMVGAIERFLGLGTSPCPCVRCQGREGLTERVERLEDCLHLDVNLELMKENLTRLEKTLQETHILLLTLHRVRIVERINPCQ